MTTKISELPSTVLPSGGHEVAAMKDDLTVKLTVDQIITLAAARVLDSAPESLDTLNELAAALGDDPNFATTVTTALAQKLGLDGGTLTGNLEIPTLNPGDASQNAANAAFVQNEKVIKAVHVLDSSTDYARTSETEGTLSDALIFTPVSTNSNFFAIGAVAALTRNTAGGNDARSSLRLSYFNTASSSHVSLFSTTVGLVNVAPGSTTLSDYLYANHPMLVGFGQQAKVYGANADQVFLRIRGETDFANNEILIYGFNIIVLEY